MVSLHVNGKLVQADADGDTPLLRVLRDYLDLTGTKFGCGMALCGACTVHVDGKPARSCVTPVSAGNICRCATYPRIRAAIKRVAKEAGMKTKERA
jgi:aerobic-type carbon monoxide dehydrogenase small subunit (CoxS/CutS family)